MCVRESRVCVLARVRGEKTRKKHSQNNDHAAAYAMVLA